MPNPYFQVARTYLERPVFSLQQPLSILFFFVWGFIFIVLIAWHKYISSLLFLFILLFSYWAIHVKEQFADTRASLTPGFRKIHGVVATIVAFVFVILLPGVIAPLIGWQPLGFISITTFLFSTILWAILRLGDNFISLIWIGWAFTLFEPTRNSIEKIFSGNEPVQAFTFLGLGAVLSITGIVRLFLLNEEKPEYHLNLKFPKDGRTKLSNLQWRKLEKAYSQGWRRWFANRPVVRMIYHARHATDSYWSRMQRWNHSNRSVWYALFNATYINLFLILIYSLSNGTFLPGIRIAMATFLPVFLVNKQFNEKSRFMAQDLMMPVRRDTYLKQVGMSFATSQFIQWGAFLFVTVLLMFPSAAKPTPEFLIISISYSLMIQIWLFGLAIWISSLRSTTMNFLFPIATILSVMFIMAMSGFSAQMTVPWWSLIIGALFACHGLLLTWRGYRRWLVADFDSEQKC